MKQVREMVAHDRNGERDGAAPRDARIVPLASATPADRARIGAKAANLAELARRGFPVPAGAVLTTAAFASFLDANSLDAHASAPDVLAAALPPELAEELHAGVATLGDAPLAVRSSGVAEDLPDASFAGQYETVLDVRGATQLEAAVKTCWASALGGRVDAYRAARGQDTGPGMAVLIQRMVPAGAAGVAFTANPVTGDRGETVISAVRGLGERLVSGQAEADEWVVRGVEATCRRVVDGVLNPEQALALAALASRIAEHFGQPQDVEWAIADGALAILQARPMTALPAPLAWTTPLPGAWVRNFRLGEWLPEPVTPLFESWLLPCIEDAWAAAIQRVFGGPVPPPLHVIVNGWYFHSPAGGGSTLDALTGLLRRPRVMWAFMQGWSKPEISERVVIAPAVRAWRDDLLPRYRAQVAAWEGRVDAATPAELTRLVDELGALAGEYTGSIGLVSGFAWKAEIALAKFYRGRLYDRVRRSPQDLLCGLTNAAPTAPPYAVQSLDWVRPTLGELPAAEHFPDDIDARRARMEADRRAAERACRAALAAQPKLLRRFEGLLDIAQRYAVLREEHVNLFTLGWPVLRRAALRLGAELRRQDVIERVDDVFFLTRPELDRGLGGHGDGLRRAVSERRREWERQRRLSPPLAVGKSNKLQEKFLSGMVEAVRVPRPDGPGLIHGMPSSPGRATGPVRVVRGPDDFARFQAGEVLVAQVTTPAWTPLFNRAAAVVTDGGTLAAHASLVAREYGIPAVVATGDATARLCDGQFVTVDGSAGVVEARS